MKAVFITLISLAIYTNCISQDFQVGVTGLSPKPIHVDEDSNELYFEILSAYSNSVTHQKLEQASFFNDITSDYPTLWVSDYISLELKATCKGKTMKAISTSAKLTAEQKQLLTNADLNSDIVVTVKYKNKNPATEKIDIRTMNYSVKVVPQVEAIFLGTEGESKEANVGSQVKLRKYIKSNAIDKISFGDKAALNSGTIKFTINDQGFVSKASVVKTTKNAQVDKQLLETIKNMPRWKPAQDAKGVNVNQDFILTVGNGSC
jgi:TonB family protein